MFGKKRPESVPGIQRPEEGIPPEAAGLMLTANPSAPLAGALRQGAGSPARQAIGREEIAKAAETLARYKQGKANLETRVVEDELWWELRHWEAIRKGRQSRDGCGGSAGSGVTAAAAIAALQEAGNKTSRDMISASYRANTAISTMCIELIRQFYDEKRSFRITGELPGSYQFVDMNNAAIRDQAIPPAYPGQELEPGCSPLFRRPVFDVKIKSQKKDPFSRMEQNERAKELYGMGFFNPERAQETLGALEMMEFEGREKVVEYARNGQTLLNICRQMSAQLDQMAALLQTLTGKDMGAGDALSVTGGARAASPRGGGGQADGIARATMEAHTPMTSYGDRLAARSKPDMNATSAGG